MKTNVLSNAKHFHCSCHAKPLLTTAENVGIRPCHTAAILSRETKRALFYHTKPRSGNLGVRLGVVKQSFFGHPGQYGRHVTRANSENSQSFEFVILTAIIDLH